MKRTQKIRQSRKNEDDLEKKYDPKNQNAHKKKSDQNMKTTLKKGWPQK